jgi:uncharacterized protein YecE (DUF72 family)
MKSSVKIRIGISGWRYKPWRGEFYPKDLIQKKELYYASRQVNSIEINGTFYSFQSPESFKKWRDETPSDFLFSVKGSRYITHIKRLKDIKIPLANFFASGVLHLNEKLGPFLWQFPPNFQFDENRLQSFFEILPHTMKHAVKLSKEADRRQPDFPASVRNSNQRLRHAIEIRNHSFENPDFIELLRKNDIALVFADTAGKWPYIEDITSDFLYLRLHGDEELYSSGYTDISLKLWAQRIKLWSQGCLPKNSLHLVDTKFKPLKEVFVYFDNDAKVHAPFDAKRLRDLISGSSNEKI